MGTDDPELIAAVERYSARTQPGTGHVVAAAVLLLVQFLLARAALVVLGLSAMSTDVCAYQDCGDQRWANRAVVLVYVGGMTVLVLSAVVVLWRLVKRRHVVAIAACACVTQVAICGVALAMMSMAGPTT